MPGEVHVILYAINNTKYVSSCNFAEKGVWPKPDQLDWFPTAPILY